MIIIMSSDFWKHYNKKRIHLLEEANGFKRVVPDDDLDMVYNLDVYEDIIKLGLGKPITHHNNLESLVEERQKNGVQPFKYLLQKFGSQFQVEMENDNTIETMFRFIYLYEKKYKNDPQGFVNNANLHDFATLE